MAWGYSKEVSSTDPAEYTFRPAIDDPFKLHFIGKPDRDAPLEISPALDTVIKIHQDTSYDEFYGTIGRMVRQLMLVDPR